MAGYTVTFSFGRLHFWRIFLVVTVSFWATAKAFGLDTPATKSSPADEIKLATSYFEKKEYAKVTPLLWKHINQLNRKDFHILLKSHSELGQPDDLLRTAGLLISKNPKDFEALHFQGRAYQMKKKDKDALESYKKALQGNPKYLPSFTAIGEIYEKKKNLYELRNLYQDMLKAFGPQADILSKLCDVNTRDGLNDIADSYCRQAIKAEPSNPENHINFAIVTLQNGEKNKAKALFKMAAEKFPKSELAQFRYASLLEEEKNYLESYVFYKTCTEQNAKSERCWLGAANSAFQIQKIEEAHTFYRKVCTFNRNYAVHVRRAVLSLRSSNNEIWARKFQDLADSCSL